MGSTVLTGKKAAAFQKADGEWVYALFERTYEKNVTPHEDHWGATTIGNYAVVMKHIFSRASSCESGMLQSRAGSIKPENYITSWQRELAKPFSLSDRSISLSVSQSFSASVCQEKWSEVRESLVQAGFAARADELAAGKLEVSLYADIDLLVAIYGTGPLSPWRILMEYECGTLRHVVPLPTPSKTAMERMPEVRLHAIDQDNRLVAIGAAPWRHAGYAYEAVGAFIRDTAYHIEMETPGFAKKAIPLFRDMMGDASPVPVNTRVTLTRAPVGGDEWHIRVADRLARRLGLTADDAPAPDVFSFKYGDLLKLEDAKECLYRLGHLSEAQMHWEVLPLDESGVSTPDSVDADAQLSLGLSQ